MKKSIQRYGVPLLYGALFVCLVWVMAVRMPLYGYVRVALALLLALDFFVWRILRHRLASKGCKSRFFWTLVYFLPLALTGAFCLALVASPIQDWPAFLRTYWMGTLLVLLATHVCYGFVWSLSTLVLHVRERRKRGHGNVPATGPVGDTGSTIGNGAVERENIPHQTAGYAAFFLFLLLFYAMVISTFNLRVDRIDMRKENPDRPVPEGFRGYRILQFTDLHIGSFTSTRQVRSLVKQALQTRPDMIVFTGDMVNYTTSEMTPFLAELSHLQAPDGVYCVLGNHDYGNYASWPNRAAKYANVQKMLDYYNHLGWTTLNNAAVKIVRGGDTLLLAGVENWGKSGRFPKRGNLKKALEPSSLLETRESWRQAEPGPLLDRNPGKGTGKEKTAGKPAPGIYTILLSHDPSHFDSVVYLRYPKVDLTLAGHTHGMQVGLRVNGKDYSPARFVYEHYSGMYVMANGQALYVNTGCGFNGLPFRLGMRPNFSLFIL